ncbi:MAG: methyltransferase domain-containing protein [Deltaproteobacteria bacterium]|nr:methyltransferase domain-containing protein [Deltaproteobacteria bacterium]
MSSDTQLILQAIPFGNGLCLDLGGNKGLLRDPLEKRGYRYINLDVRHFGGNEPSLIGDAHLLPFKDDALDMVVSKDTLEHFLEPKAAVTEVHRVLKTGGQFVIWVPWMHPFHGDDFYRYSPIGLKHLLRDFDLVSLESPLGVFTVVGLATIEALKRIRLGFLEQPLKHFCRLLDRFFTRHQKRPASFAAAYLIVACKPVN